MKNKSLISLHSQISQQKMMLAPSIGKVMQQHQKNQLKQIKSQHANHKIIADFQQRKLTFQNKTKNKQQEIIKRLSADRKKKLNSMKKQSEHVQKVIEKYHRMDKLKMEDKLEKINKRNQSINKSIHDDNGSLSMMSSVEHKKSRYLSNSLDLRVFYDRHYMKNLQKSQQIMNKSMQKQQKAFQNRKLLHQNSRIKQLNQSKYIKQIKADEYLQNKQHNIIRKSISRLQSLQKRREQQIISQRKRSIEKKENDKKNIQKIKNKRQALQLDLEQKFANIQKIMKQRSQRVNQNKQNLRSSLVELKKSKRVKLEQQNQSKHNFNLYSHNSKMSQKYKKDREQWGFLTSIGQFKQILIEKNIYENNQLALLK